MREVADNGIQIQLSGCSASLIGDCLAGRGKGGGTMKVKEAGGRKGNRKTHEGTQTEELRKGLKKSTYEERGKRNN